MGLKVNRGIEICGIVESIPFPYGQVTLSESYSLPGLQYSHLWTDIWTVAWIMKRRLLCKQLEDKYSGRGNRKCKAFDLETSWLLLFFSNNRKVSMSGMEWTRRRVVGDGVEEGSGGQIMQGHVDQSERSRFCSMHHGKYSESFDPGMKWPDISW